VNLSPTRTCISELGSSRSDCFLSAGSALAGDACDLVGALSVAVVSPVRSSKSPRLNPNFFAPDLHYFRLAAGNPSDQSLAHRKEAIPPPGIYHMCHYGAPGTSVFKIAVDLASDCIPRKRELATYYFTRKHQAHACHATPAIRIRPHAPHLKACLQEWRIRPHQGARAVVAGQN